MKLRNKNLNDATTELHIMVCWVLDQQVFDIYEFLQTGDLNKLKQTRDDVNRVLGWYIDFNPFVIADYELSSGDVLDLDIKGMYNWKLYVNKREYRDIANDFKNRNTV